MNDRSRMMLYALTAVACVMWIWQSVKESMNDGTIISTSNIIFLVCIGIAAIYCAANALILWWRQPGKAAAADDDETDSTDAEAKPNKPKKTNTTTLPTPQTPTPQTPKKTTTHSTKGTSWMQPHCQ